MKKSLTYASAVALTLGLAASAFSANAQTSEPLINVNLENILNNLAVDLKVDRANIPVTAQIPVNIAANVCGVSVNALSAQIASGGGSTCTAVTGSQELTQSVQQQMAASGTVTGTQSGTTVGSTTTGSSGTSSTSGAAPSGTSSTSGSATGTTSGTTADPADPAEAAEGADASGTNQTKEPVR
jgi:hypothetical protein